jgi:hypothetical protein
MLNPPLSLLSDDLLAYIVDHIEKFPYSLDDLYNLSLAFTRSCQADIFKDLHLYDYESESRISRLEKIGKILNDEPSFASRVRTVKLTYKQIVWLFDDPTFISIIQLLEKSLMPPHKLHLFPE